MSGWAEERVRDLKCDVLRELVTEYPIEGVELDFTAAFSERGFFYFSDGGTPENTAAMTEWVRRSAEMVRSRPGEPGVVGARIFPTEKGNLEQGLDVRTWLGEGLLDFVVPVAYIYTVLDPDMPFDWVVESSPRRRMPRSMDSCSTTRRTKSSAPAAGGTPAWSTSGPPRPTTGRRVSTACTPG